MKYLKLFFLIFLFTYYNSSANTFNPDIFVHNIDVADENKGNIFLSITGYILIFILGCISVIVYFYFRIKGILKEEYDFYKSEIRGSYEKYPSFIFGVIQFLKERKNSYKNSTPSSKNQSTNNSVIEDLRKDNIILDDRYTELEKKYLVLEGQSNSNIPTGENVIAEQTGNIYQQEIKAKVLYFSIPDEDGSFSEETASVTAFMRSYYKIEYFEGDSAAKLIYRSGNLDASALSQMDYILGPVCEIENSSMNNPTKIIIESHGTVVQEDDKWKIKDKIKLKLI